MTDKEIDRLARELLTKAVKEIQTWDSAYFYSVDQMSKGDIIVTFAGTGPDGQGSFACELMPLDTVRTLIKSCGVVYDESLLIFKKTIGDSVNVTVPQLLGESRKTTVSQMAWHVTLNLIAFFRTRLSDAIEDAIADGGFIGEVLLGGAIAHRLNELVPGVAVADFRKELKVRLKHAADKKEAWLRNHTAKLPHVLVKRGRGAPIKSEFTRRAEREKFLADVDSAYRALRLREAKPPRKTDVARQLGIGGDPTRGGQSALQVFNAKLKRLEIDYKDLKARIEKELH